MLRSTLQRRWGAATLALVFVAMWSLRVGHVLLAHHHHEAQHVCELSGSTDSAHTHLHDAHFLGEDCSVCSFVVGAVPLPTLPDLVLRPAEPRIAQPPVAYHSVSVRFSGATSLLRGPPTRG
jgi:hypothetical protein